VRLLAVHCRVSTWMGDHLRAGKPSRYVYQSPRSTQPSIPLVQLNLVPSCLAGFKAECVHLCRVAGNTVIPYGK